MIRRTLAYWAMRFALWANMEVTLSLAMALAAENARRMMASQGISHFTPEEDEHGEITMHPVFFDHDGSVH